MTFAQSVRACFRKYATFSGRASRSEYWWFVLFQFLVAAVFGFIEGVANAVTGAGEDGPQILTTAFNLAVFIPGLAVGWRRMHDTGRSGLYLLYPLLVMIGIGTYLGLTGTMGAVFPADGGDMTPLQGVNLLVVALAGLVFLISPLLVLWWLTRPSQPGDNAYGPHPAEAAP